MSTQQRNIPFSPPDISENEINNQMIYEFYFE